MIKTGILLVGLAFALPALAQSTVEVTDLRCEYMTNPLGIDAPTPRFSWKLIDSKYTRGQKQTGYHILVASSKSLLDKNRGDIWDSGEITSDQSVLVPFNGTALRANQDCYWKVRVADKDGRATAWSEAARFSMGLLQPSDWKGSWIKHPDAPKESHIWYRRSFNIDKINTAFMHVASMGYHELYINGRKADNRVLAPLLTRIDKRVMYVTYDIASLLHKGKNTIAIWYGPGWSRNEFFGRTIFPSLRAQLNAGDFVLATDASWKCQVSSSKNTGNNRYEDHGAECVDARQYLPDWNTTGFDDSKWPQAVETHHNVILSAHNMEPARIIDSVTAIAVTDTLKGIYKVDLGKNFTGWVQVKLKGMAAGDTVRIMVADDPETIQDWAQGNIYICRGGGEETFRNRFNYTAGRYINISGLKSKPSPDAVKGYVIATDIERTGHFSCSNPLFNKIYETDLWTYRMCTTEGYTADCPHRERLGYGEEVFATAWGIGMPNYNAGAFYTKHVRDWSDVQEENGWTHHTAPQWNEHYGGPMWSSAGLNVAWEFYTTYGDKKILEAYYPSGKKWLEFLHTKSQFGLLEAFSGGGKFLGDWAAPGGRKEFGGTPEATFFNNCVYAMNLETMIRMAGILGHQQDSVTYAKRLRFLKTRINAQFFDPALNSYMNGDQVQTAFPLLTGIVPPTLYEQVLAGFREKITAPDAYFDMGSSGLPVLLKFLTEDREFNEAFSRILSKTNEPSYGYFLEKGETTWPEYWSVNVTSKIHTCFTGISSWFIKSLAGIRPDPGHPGYRSFIIKPSPVSNVSHAEAETASLYGIIKSGWKKEGGRLNLNITVPVNTEATVYFPLEAGKRITESGRDSGSVKEIMIIGEREGRLLAKVPAGKYLFVVER